MNVNCVRHRDRHANAVGGVIADMNALIGIAAIALSLEQDNGLQRELRHCAQVQADRVLVVQLPIAGAGMELFPRGGARRLRIYSRPRPWCGATSTGRNSRTRNDRVGGLADGNRPTANPSLDSNCLGKYHSHKGSQLSSEAKVYDLESYQPGKGVGQLMYRVRAAHMNALDEVLAKDPDLAPLEISAAQYVVISVLAKSKCVDSATQLCKDLSYDAGAMTRMVDRLEAKGLISRRRCPDDRRLVKLELTEAGLAALPKLRECSVRVLNHFLRGFTQSEARQLESFLVRMLQNT
jgi:DNA-binding MarR family transcriptional regulator